MSAREVNFDSIVGPTHNYAGLSPGNIASEGHAGLISRPRDAALEGLAKMRSVMEMGITQGVLPPHHRPELSLLRAAGFAGTAEELLRAAGESEPRLLAAACSASPMWAANAATVAPSSDTTDGRLHLTTANLVSNLHRSIEHEQTTRTLRAIFADESKFAVHGALPSALADEGAANHSRLAPTHGDTGVHFFVYGRNEAQGPAPTKYPARQTLMASAAVARLNALALSRTVFAQQHPAAIDAGVFHNDVIAVANQTTLLYHELSFLDEAGTLEALRQALAPAELQAVRIDLTDLTVDEAVKTYLFNSQLLSVDNGMVLLAPSEVRDHDRAREAAESLVGRGGITEMRYAEVRQSMANGGGPACLRLRVVVNDQELEAMNRGVLLDHDKIATLEDWVRRHYRETMNPSDLLDPNLEQESKNSLEELARILGLGAIYAL